MKKLNTKGFSAVEILLVILIVAVLGGIGYHVYNTQKTKTQKQEVTSAAKTTNSDAAQTTATKPATEKYENKKYGFSFEYPVGWKVQTASAESPLTLYITSPNYKTQEGGYGGTIEGASIQVIAGSISSGKLSYYSTSSILANTAKAKSTFTEQKEVKVSGVSGVEYKASYEGPISLTTQIDKGDTTYSITLGQDIDGPGFNSYTQEYKDLVSSFKLTN